MGYRIYGLKDHNGVTEGLHFYTEKDVYEMVSKLKVTHGWISKVTPKEDAISGTDETVIAIIQDDGAIVEI